GHGYELRIDQRTWTDTLQSVHHDALASGKTIRHHAQAIDEHAQRHLAIGSLVVVADHHDVFLVLVGADRALVNYESRLGLGLAHAQARELARNESAVGIAKRSAHPHGAALRIDLVVDKLQVAFVGGAVGRGGIHPHRNVLDLRVSIGTEGPESARHHL